ncbi:hypothetical protein B0J13DRAFT_619637 [Dactylonectria estremocensis]|uniref:Uncharacterized protein n=1 Tax=Dactylonectria estremocensis TaxID=1079267 RepID=A0A9P9F3C0_9HYPO|nr:hypothetical protein B0J13DRAFT_619637 [Dactylonectria estremocensis]
MSAKNLIVGITVMTTLLGSTMAQQNPSEDLILCDCGTGDNPDHPEWSTSRQMNWYKDIEWPEGAYDYPNAPDMSVQVPFNDGLYPWIPSGATAKMPNDDVWTAYIEDGTPDGFKAGSAVTTKEGGQMLNCWAYRGRPVSVALNKTANPDSICWSAFVCNRDNNPPPRPGDMGSQSSTSTASSAPATSYFSTAPAAPLPTTTGGESVPTQAPETNALFVSASVNPRFINWNSTWQDFVSKFAWDQATGRCVSDPVRGDGYTINIDCAGIQIDADSHMTLILIRALYHIGLNSTLFNQNPVVPGQNSGNGNRSNSTSWVVMPESFSLQATDKSNQHAIGYLSYNTTYDNFISGPCATCDTTRFDSEFFDPIIEAMQGTYPLYNSYHIQAQCHPWMACEKL